MSVDDLQGVTARVAAQLAGLRVDEVGEVLDRLLAGRVLAVDRAVVSSVLLGALAAGGSGVAPARNVYDTALDAYRDRDLVHLTQSAVLQVDMLSATGVADALGSSGRNTRDLASRLRRSGALLGLVPPGSRAYLYPAFQVDPTTASVRDVVGRVNRALDALGDPWGVASWWTSPHARLDEGRSPMDLIGAADEGRLLVLAGSLVSGPAEDATTGHELLAPA